LFFLWYLRSGYIPCGCVERRIINSRHKKAAVTSGFCLSQNLVASFLFEIVHQPCQCRSWLAVTNETSAFPPSRAVFISPQRNTYHLWVLIEDREVHLHVLQLSLIIRGFDVVFGYV